MNDPKVVEVMPIQKIVSVNIDPKIVAITLNTNNIFSLPANSVEINNATIVSPHFYFEQNTPSLSWIINHNLNSRPVVQLFSTGGRQIIGDIIHTTVNQVIAYFAYPIAGYAQIN